MRKIISNNYGSAIFLIVFVLTIFSAGAFYTVFFIEIIYPTIVPLVPDTISIKTTMLMLMYGIPIFILVVCGVAVLKDALKKEVYY